MISKPSKLLLLFSLVAGLSGCASIMSPFNSEFSCADNPTGKCVPPLTAYNESLGKNSPPPKTKEDGSAEECCLDVKKKDAPPVKSGPTDGEISYREASLNKMAKLLKNPTTPMVVPPTILRVLILPYQSDDEDLLMPRYVYFMADKAKWIVGDYLSRTDGGE